METLTFNAPAPRSLLQAFVATGTNIQLVFHAGTNGYTHGEHGRDCDFEKEHGKVGVYVHGPSTVKKQ